jgi:hypothetical protein
MEGSLVAYKVFTNGSVLQASEINDNLMRQSVMVFSNAAARTAAITSPIEGMLTWLEDVNRYEFYNGTAWVSDNTGLVQLASQTFTGVSSVAFNTLFSDLYRDYQFIYQGSASSTGNDLLFRYRSGVTDNTTSDYFSASVRITNAAGPTRNYGGGTSAIVATFGNVANTFSLTMSNPFTAAKTLSFGQSTATGTTADHFSTNHQFKNDDLSFDGINFIMGSGTFSGTITAYGYRR